MKAPVTNSSLDVAYWFINHAEQEGIYLEDEKLHHLLFLAQKEYAQRYNNQMLMPCLFLCGDKGFFEPTIKRIFAQGRPFMPLVKFDEKTALFLEDIWRQYSSLSLAECKKYVMQLPLYIQCYRQGEYSVVEWHSLIDKHQQNNLLYNDEKPAFQKKVLVSQNGPVVVSQWRPRKVINKDYLHE